MSNFILNNENTEIDLGILSFIDKITNNEPIEFTTSGTTSEPKRVIHSVDSLSKNIKIKNDLKNSIWGLTFDYSKMAGSQVILQSYLNGGKLVNLYNKSKIEVVNLINDFKITHISATPTFYRLLVGDTTFDMVKQVTVSGECIDEFLIDRIKKAFPIANFTNIYALTEFGTLFASNSYYFEITEKYKSFIMIKNDNIFVKQNESWINTGDVVEMVGTDKFKIIGRDTNMINVGGVKVNPIKIENIINKLDYIKNSYIYSEKNYVMGNVVCVDLILNTDVPMRDIKLDFAKILTPYERPLKINIVESMNTNSTGKIIRK
jgi:acyl-coenzyme A synthetase/AMP-(fatty) acid ligase